ncbi:HpcH/HpaI aldolase family protein [Nocardioides hwasunensis]|uniref:2,4-dihydroxyhept-2-ene-1,7-dioic acid aldolase n=1 Tax=Nocardioides hwasunensis TaxID=397258 RepID=A0ABR8MHQ0_9ACTN|nr:aldolase/citrate lyase family protein [Nocardioides hwasunensis]MBD3915598.1 2,4-dihydroxyhept-2-ene-1,7-dioic acid aldolase [Nocardioides hwasunensis]
MTGWGVDGGTAWGAWVKLDAVESTQILAAAGFDLVVVDLEHTLLDLGAVARHLAVGQALGLRVLVRIPDRSPALVQRLLDAGVDGLVVPHVDSAADAADLVASTRFAPDGRRGSGGTSRAGGWGRSPRADYLSSAATVVAQVESVRALAEAHAIAAVPGVSALMLGPADLALDAGDPVADADETLVTAARASGVAVGSAGTVAAAGRASRLGLDFFVCAADTTLLARAAADALDRARSGSSSASRPSHQISERGAPA